MTRQSPGLRRLIRAFSVMVFAMLMLIMTAFATGAVPSVVSDQAAVATVDNLQDLPADSGTALNLDNAPLDEEGVVPVEEMPMDENDAGELADHMIGSPEVDAGLEMPGMNSLMTTLDAGMGILSEPTFTEPHLKWEVKQNGVHVGGTTVDVRGPRASLAFWVYWEFSTSVKDCVSDINGCEDTLDKDPRPGYFAITHLSTSSNSAVNRGSVYAIQPNPTGLPTGKEWASLIAWTQIPATGNTVSNRTWPQSEPGYQFPDLAVRDLPSVTWRVTHGGVQTGGAVVTLEGPLNRQNVAANSVQVQDCVAAPCAPTSMDQDPASGAFKVSTMRWGSADGFKTQPVSSSERYRIKPSDSPVGYAWEAPNSTLEIPGSWTSQEVYDFGAFTLKQANVLSWTVSDAANAPVAGSTVRVNGHSTQYYVTDCTIAPCHPESMDQDPTPGSFQVDTLRGLDSDGLIQTTQEVTANATYTLLPVGSISGYSWRTSTTQSIRQNQPGPDLKVETRTTRSGVCEASNSYFSLARPSNTSARILQNSYSGDERVLNPSATTVSSIYTMLGQQASNALGVTPTGIFYFTGQLRTIPTSDADIAKARNTTIYRYDPSSGQPYPVFNMDLLSPTTGTVVGGDATIYQGREEFYFAYLSDKPAISPLQGDGVRFHLYRYSHGNGERTGEVTHVDVPRPSNLTQFNGDFAFDAQNNIQFIVSQEGNQASGSVQVKDFQAMPSAHTLPEVPTITGNSNATRLNYGSINGVAYTASGRGIIQIGSEHRIVEMPSLNSRTSRTVSMTGSAVDLASCATPATITVQKELVGDRYDADDQFILTASSKEGAAAAQEFSSATTSGNQSGIQREQIGPFAASLAGTFTATESFINADSSHYQTSWKCYALDGSGNLGVAFASGEGTSLSLGLTGAYAEIKPGADILCRFTNVTLRDRLQVGKIADPPSRTQLNPGARVSYTLDFDNSTGTSGAAVDHVDHLSDALDDADFVNAAGEIVDKPAFTVEGGLEVTWNATDKQISISGSVAPRATARVSYTLQTKPNEEDAATRSDDLTSTNGYLLRNYLTIAGATELPEQCVPGGDSSVVCTEHPISAWSVFKDSRPASGARLHKGGNAHYRVVAQKETPGTVINDLVFTDDLTNVFRTAGFDPEAVVPGGALPRGIYFFDEFGHSLEPVENGTVVADILGHGSTTLPAVTAEQVGVPEKTGDKWILETLPVAVPRNAVRAELWFAVRAGEPMTLPGAWPTNASDITMTPKMGDKFTNYVTASASIQPTTCQAGTAPSELPMSCQVTHQLQDNYFTIRKDAMGPGVDQVNLVPDSSPSLVSDPAYGADKTGMWNMIGHKFEIRDNVDGSPSDYQSPKLCRTEYNPSTGWMGEFTVPGPDAVFDIGEDSATLAAIVEWNNQNPEQELPLCGLLYEQGNIDNLGDPSNPGGQTGRWRSENLPAGDYWLVETKAPTHQISEDGRKKRPVPGIQLLPEPIPFRVWQDAAGDVAGTPPSNYGLGQLDVSRTGTFSNSDWLGRCQPGADAGQRPTACVNPTGYLLLVKDVTTITLPFSGGQLLTSFTAVGAMLMALASLGIFWWRRRE